MMQFNGRNRLVKNSGEYAKVWPNSEGKKVHHHGAAAQDAVKKTKKAHENYEG